MGWLKLGGKQFSHPVRMFKIFKNFPILIQDENTLENFHEQKTKHTQIQIRSTKMFHFNNLEMFGFNFNLFVFCIFTLHYLTFWNKKAFWKKCIFFIHKTSKSGGLTILKFFITFFQNGNYIKSDLFLRIVLV